MKVTAQIQILHTLMVVRDVLEYLWRWLSIMKRMIHPLFLCHHSVISRTQKMR